MLVGSAAESPRVRAVKALVERPCRGMERWRALARMLEEGVYGSRAELAGRGRRFGNTRSAPEVPVEIDDILRSTWPPNEESLRALLDEACVDAYDEYEQATGLLCVIEEWGGVPCAIVVGEEQGMLIEAELREVTLVGHVRFGRIGPIPVPLEDVVPEPGTPAAFLVATYRLWRGLQPLVLERG